MHMLAKLFLIGASATVIHAQQGHWDINMPDARIKFCKEKDLGGKCYTEPLQNGVCKLIPDSNASGDKGSSYGVSHIRVPFRRFLLTLDDTDLQCSRCRLLPTVLRQRVRDSGALQIGQKRPVWVPNVEQRCMQ